MKITLNEYQFVEKFTAIRPTQFSVEALRVLFAHLEELERDLGDETEFDPVAVCCDWTEYASALEAAEVYGFKPAESDDEKADTSEQQSLEFLCDATTVLELSNGGVVVFNF